MIGITILEVGAGMKSKIQDFQTLMGLEHSLNATSLWQVGLGDNWEIGGNLTFALTGAYPKSIDLDGYMGTRLFTKLQVTDSTTSPYHAAFILGFGAVDGSTGKAQDRNEISSSMVYSDIAIPFTFIASPTFSFTLQPRILFGSYRIKGVKAKGYIPPPSTFGILQPLPAEIYTKYLSDSTGYFQTPQGRFVLSKTLPPRPITTEEFIIVRPTIIPCISFGFNASASPFFLTRTDVRGELTLSYFHDSWAASFGMTVFIFLQ